jgi:transposase
MKRRGRYSNEYKREVLRMAETTDKSISELERDLGLSPGLVRKWQQRYRIREEDETLQGSEEGEAAAEIRRLKRELEITRQERDILKHILRLVTYNNVVIEAQRKDRAGIQRRPRILKWERTHPYALSGGSCC